MSFLRCRWGSYSFHSRCYSRCSRCSSLTTATLARFPCRTADIDLDLGTVVVVIAVVVAVVVVVVASCCSVGRSVWDRDPLHTISTRKSKPYIADTCQGHQEGMVVLRGCVSIERV